MGTPRWSLAAGAIGAVQAVTVAVVDGATRPGYDACRHWVSQLSLGPGGALGTANLAGCGGWLILYGLGLRHHLDPARTAGWAARMVLLCGAALAVVAAVPIDPGLGYPPGSVAVHTPAGYLHQAAALVLFGAGTAAAVLLGRCLRGVFPRAARTGGLVALGMTVSFVAASVLVTLDVTGVVTGTPSGLWERVALFTGLCWNGVAGLCLLHGGAPREDAPP